MTSLARCIDADSAPEARDLINTMLDLCEQQMEAVIAAGGEAALKTRIARLLPEPAPVPVAATPVLDVMEVASVLSALRTGSLSARGDAARDQNAHARAIVTRWLEKAKGSQS